MPQQRSRNHRAPREPLHYCTGLRCRMCICFKNVSRAPIYRMIHGGDLLAIKLGPATHITADSLIKAAATPEHTLENHPP